MKRTRFSTATERQALSEDTPAVLLEIFSSDAYLTINKRLLRRCGPKKAIFLSNLVNKYLYFQSRGLLEGDRFYLTHEHQMEETGLSERTIRQCKSYFKGHGVLSTLRRGQPVKEWYRISVQHLFQLVDLPGHNLANSSGHNLANSSGLYKENKDKENKDKENKDKKSKSPVKNKETTTQRRTHLPEDSPARSDLEKASSYWTSKEAVLDSITEAAKFRAHHESQGSLMVNWSAAWRTWYIHAVEYQAKREGSPHSSRARLLHVSTRARKSTRSGPRALTERYFNGNQVLVKGFLKGPYSLAKEELLSALQGNGTVERALLAKALLDLFDYVDAEQETHFTPKLRELLSGPMEVVSQYMHWVQEATWISSKDLRILQPDSGVFRRFREDEARNDSLERDPLTGRSSLR